MVSHHDSHGESSKLRRAGTKLGHASIRSMRSRLLLLPGHTSLQPLGFPWLPASHRTGKGPMLPAHLDRAGSPMSYWTLEPSFNSSHVILWSAMCQALSSRAVSTCLISAGSAEPIPSTPSGISGYLHWVPSGSSETRLCSLQEV